VQLRYETGLTSTQYVSRQAWCDASLERCPLHAKGGCGFARHGTYERVHPPGTRVARWYCREGHQTFSLLPDCLAARFSGTLFEFESAVDQVEQAATLETAAKPIRIDIELPGVLRWLRRRVQAVQTILVVVKGLLPERFGHCAPALVDFRQALVVDCVLVALRAVAADWLADLPPPLGFDRRISAAAKPRKRLQHRAGPDPPRSPA
jgi:hypothetical protein